MSAVSTSFCRTLCAVKRERFVKTIRREVSDRVSFIRVSRFVSVTPARLSGSDREIAQARKPCSFGASLPDGYLFRHQTKPLDARSFRDVDDLSDIVEEEIV